MERADGGLGGGDTGPEKPGALAVSGGKAYNVRTHAYAYLVLALSLLYDRPLVEWLLYKGDAQHAEMGAHLRHLAALLADQARAAGDLELVDEPVLNVVPFRFAPEGVRRRDLDDLNERLGRAVLDDGRVAVGLTRYRSVVCLRPAIANWRTGEDDVRLVVEVVRELGSRLLR